MISDLNSRHCHCLPKVESIVKRYMQCWAFGFPVCSASTGKQLKLVWLWDSSRSQWTIRYPKWTTFGKIYLAATVGVLAGFLSQLYGDTVNLLPAWDWESVARESTQRSNLTYNCILSPIALFLWYYPTVVYPPNIEVEFLFQGACRYQRIKQQQLLRTHTYELKNACNKCCSLYAMHYNNNCVKSTAKAT